MSKHAFRQARRSGTSCCDVCGRTARLVEHHIHGREVKNWTGAWNVSWVCPTCHDRVHAGDVIIEGWFQTTAGRELVHRLKGEAPKLTAGAQPHLYG